MTPGSTYFPFTLIFLSAHTLLTELWTPFIFPFSIKIFTSGRMPLFGTTREASQIRVSHVLFNLSQTISCHLFY